MQAVVVTGPGGSGVSTAAAALALAASAAGRQVALACLHDDGSLASLVEGAPRRLRPLVLTEPGRWDVFDQAVADGLQRLGAEGLAAEEVRQLPSVGPLRAVVRLAEAALGFDFLVLDAGPLPTAADLLDTATRVPWILRQCLGAQAAAGRALGHSAVELSRLTDRAEAGAELLRGGVMRVDVVLPGIGTGRAKVRRALPGLVLSGGVPGLLIHATPHGSEGAVGSEGPTAQDWAPLIPVTPASWPRVDAPSGPDALAALGAELQAAWRAGSDGRRRPEAADADGQSTRDASGGSGESLRIRGNTLLWRLPLPWVATADVQVERRADDLLIRVHGRSHLAPMPAAARRGHVRAAGVDGATLVVDVELPDRGWGGGA